MYGEAINALDRLKRAMARVNREQNPDPVKARHVMLADRYQNAIDCLRQEAERRRRLQREGERNDELHEELRILRAQHEELQNEVAGLRADRVRDAGDVLDSCPADNPAAADSDDDGVPSVDGTETITKQSNINEKGGANGVSKILETSE